MTNEIQGTANVSRRTLLRATGALAAASGLGLAGCGGSPPNSREGANGMTIPLSGADIPDGDVSFRWLDNGDLRRAFWNDFFIPAYARTHPNITFQYDGLPQPQIREAVSLGLRNGTVHDVFTKPEIIDSVEAISNGNVLPLDDIIPNFEQWKAAFPDNTFYEGIHVFDGKTYTFPVSGNDGYGTALHYNQRLMEHAGYDLSEQLSYDEYRDAARRVTRAGDGQFFGVTFGAEPRIFETQLSNFTTIAGLPSRLWINPLTGEFIFNSDELLTAIELFLAMNSDGSFFPGVVSLSQQEAYASFPQGQAGMIMTGPWVLSQWHQFPDFEFSVGPMPSPGGAGSDPFPLDFNPPGNFSPWVFGDTPYPEVAGDILHYLGSPEGNRIFSAFTAIGQPPIHEGVLADKDDPAVQQAIALALKSGVDNTAQGVQAHIDLARTTVAGPVALIRNPQVSQVNAVLQQPVPSLGEIVQAAFVGEVTDLRSALQDLQDRANLSLDQAISTAQQGGANVSRDDYVFPNYDPRQDYGPDDYAAL